MYKIINMGIPKYFADLIPKRKIGYNIRNRNKPFFKYRTESFKKIIFPIYYWDLVYFRSDN